MADHYKLLQVRRDASPEVIAAAYRRLMRDAHPDTGGDAEEAKRLNLAYEVLSDPERRAAYDRTLGTGSSRPAGPHLVVDVAYRVGVSIGRRAARLRADMADSGGGTQKR